MKEMRNSTMVEEIRCNANERENFLDEIDCECENESETIDSETETEIEIEAEPSNR